MHFRPWRTWAALISAAAFLAIPGALMGETSAVTAPTAPASQSTGNTADTNAPGKAPTSVQASGTTEGTPAAPDSLTRPKSRADTVLVVKHSFDHREQIITGSVVMTCLALMLVIMNNYNPR